MKKLFSVVLCLLMVAALLPLHTAGADTSGTCGDNLTWTYDESTCTLTITGSGAMEDYAYDTVPWYSIRSDITAVSLPDGLTSIGSNTFCYCRGLLSITIPDSVTSIGDYAFYYCTGLTSITIPDSVTSIGNYAFYNCTGLTSITIPDSVTSIGQSAFSGCTGLTSITIPDSVTSIGYQTFSGCSGLTSITIPDGVTSIGEGAFKYCTGLTSITIPDSVTSIGGGAFYGCTGLTSITIPDSVTSIGGGAFYGCTGLTSITMPCSTIGSSAFGGCTAITSVHLTKGTGTMADYKSSTTPWYESRNNAVTIVLDDGIQNIGDYAFYYCTGLTEITIPDSVTSIGDGAFGGCTGLTSIIIPDGVTSIGWGAFGGCTGLTSITIPDGVTSIESCTFSGCSGLTSITIPDGVTSIGREAFGGCTGLTSVTIPDSVTSIESDTFSGCSGLTEITIGNGVTNIGDYAFPGCKGLTSVTIPDSVTSIGEGAFYECTGLTSITIPDSVTSIGGCAFYGCSGLTDVYYLGTEEQQAEIWFEEGNDPLINAVWHYNTDPDPVQKCGNNLYWAFDETTGTLTITGSGDMWDYDRSDHAYAPWYTGIYGASPIRQIEIAQGVTHIGSCAFDLCDGITTISIPESVVSIGDKAFNSCQELSDVQLSEGLEVIGDRAFQGCYNLDMIEIPSTVTTVGSFVFGAGDATIDAVFHGNPPNSIGRHCFTDEMGCWVGAIIYPDEFSSAWSPNGETEWNGYAILPRSQYALLSGSCGTGLTWYFDDASGLLSIEGNGEMTMDELPAILGGDIPYTFTKQPWKAHRKDITGVVLSDGIVNISSKAFQNCTGLTSVTIPDGVTSIGRFAFNGCSNLMEISLPDGVTSISWDAFYGCTGLTKITIPDSVTSIDDYAFYDCSALTDVYYLGTEAQKAEIMIGSENDCLENATWHYLHAQTVSKSLTLEGDIKINFYVVVSDDALADEGSYARLTLNGKTTEMLAKDAPVSVKDGVTRRQFTQSIVAKEMQDEVALELFDGSGRRLALFDSDGTEVHGALIYAANDYAEAARESDLGEPLKALVQACANYGTAAQIQFGYEADGLTLPAAVTSVTAAQLAPFEAAYTGALPAGVERNTSTLLLESDNSIRQYFYLASGHSIDEYAFTVDGVLTDPVKAAEGKYYLEVKNIPAKLLDDAHIFAIVDKTDNSVVLYSVEFSALSYAYKALSYDDTISPVNLKNMARAIFLYNQAANDYFDNN